MIGNQSFSICYEHSELQLNDNIFSFMPSGNNFFKTATALKCTRYVVSQTVFQEPEHIKQSGFPCTICTDNNAETGDILHFNITECLEIFDSQVFDFHCLTPIRAIG